MPLQIEIAFGKRIDALFHRLAVKALSVATARAEKRLTEDAPDTDHAALKKGLEAENDFTLEEAQELAQEVANENARQMKRSLRGVRPGDGAKSLGVKIPELADDKVRAHAERTVREIEGITTAIADRIAPVVAKAVGQGARGESFAQEIAEKLGIEKKAAKRIAIGQVIRINSQVTRERHEELGVTKYKWRATDDGFTRAWHRKLNNTIHSYADPPMGGGGGPKDTGNPGTADVCRCQAIPIFDAAGAAPEPPKANKAAAEAEAKAAALAQAKAAKAAAAAKAKLAKAAAVASAKTAAELEAAKVAKAKAEAEAARVKAERDATREAHRVRIEAEKKRAAAQPAPLVKSGQELARATQVQFAIRGPETAISATVSSALDRVGFRAMHGETPGQLQFTDVSVKTKDPGGKASDRLREVIVTPEINEVYDGAPGFYSPQDRLIRVSSNPDHYFAAGRALQETVDTTLRPPVTNFRGEVKRFPVGVPGGTRHIAKTVEEDAEMVAVHEFGHSVHLNHADKLLGARVNDIVEAAYSDPRREAVSTYGDEKPHEFFAEAFTAYWHYPPGWMRRNAPKMLKMVEDVLQLRGMPLNPAA